MLILNPLQQTIFIHKELKQVKLLIRRNLESSGYSVINRPINSTLSYWV